MAKSRKRTLLWAVLFLFSSLASHAASNRSLLFNGVDQYAEVSGALIPSTGEFTVEVWAKADPAITGFREIVSQSAGTGGINFYIGRSVDGLVRVGDNWTTVSGVSYPSDGQWHHFAVVNTADSTTLYLDGERAATRSTPIGNPAGNLFRIGRQYGDHTEYFPGNIDEIRIWNTSRSADEIQSNLYNELSGTETGLLAYYKMGSEEENLTDNGPNGHDGVKHNSVSWDAAGFPANTFTGIGSLSSPFEISTLDDLQLLSQTPDLWHRSFLQTADIDAAQTGEWNGGAGFSPIGNFVTAFTGDYDGAGHVISNLSITRNAHAQGLFGITEEATIKRLGIEAASVNSSGSGDGAFSGTLAGRVIGSTVQECYGSGSVHANSHSGGLIGHSMGATVVRNCYSRADVTVDLYDVGGLIGPIDGPGQVINCYSSGSVGFPDGAANIGGLVGRGGTVVNSFWNIETSGIATSSRGTGKTTSEMKQLASYNGWIFADMWHIDESDTDPANEGYPSLAWQGLTHDHIGVPNPPVITSVASIRYHTATVLWDSIPTATQGYVLDVATDENFTSFAVGYGGKAVPEGSICDLQNLDQNSTYYVRVRSVNDQGEGPNSTILSFKTIDIRYYFDSPEITFDRPLIPDTGDFTIEFWKETPLNTILTQGDFSILQDGSNSGDWRYQVSKGSNMLESKILDPALTWTHFAIVKKGSAIKLYENGFLMGFNNPDSLGFSPSRENTVINGKFDELRIWNYARTSQNIISCMYPGEIRGNETGLVAYVDFNEGSGSTVTCAVTGSIGTADAGFNSEWYTDTKTRALTHGFAVWQHSHRPQNIQPHQASVIPVSEKNFPNRNHSLLQVWVDSVKTTNPAMVNKAYDFKDTLRWKRGPEWLVPEDTSGVLPKYYALNSEVLADSNDRGHRVTDVFFQYEAEGTEKQTISTTFKIDVTQQDSLNLLSHYTHTQSAGDEYDKRVFAFSGSPLSELCH